MPLPILSIYVHNNYLKYNVFLGFSASCRTCKDELCFAENILVIECNKNTPILPFKVSLHRNREDLQYGCLEVEYLNGESVDQFKKI